MDSTTKQVMGQTLQPQTPVKKIHQTIISIDTGEDTVYNSWLENIIDTADVTTNIDDFKDGDVIDYDAYYRAVYNEIKQFIQNKLNYAVGQWKETDQNIIT